MDPPIQKRRYTSPTLASHGTVEALTRETSSGNNTDQDFPAGTPIIVILEGGLS